MPEYTMPDPGQSRAPSYTGDPETLERFFDELDRHAERIPDIDDRAKVMTWARIAKEHLDNWNEFKNAIYEQYPGSRDSETADLSELLQLIEETSKIAVMTVPKLGQYQRKFTNLVVTLQESETVSTRQAVDYFLSPFPEDIIAKVDNILLAWEPKKARKEVYTLQNVYKALLFIYNGGLGLTKASTVRSGSTPPPATAVKTEPDFQLMMRTAVQEAMSQFVSQLSQQRVAAAPATPSTSQAPQQTATTAPALRPPRPSGCLFCGGQDHYLRFCNEARRYESEGLMKRNENNKYATPTGIEINRAMRGTFLKEQIDNWHIDNPGHRTTSTATASSNIVTVSHVQTADSDTDAKVAELTNAYQLSSSEVANLRQILANGVNRTKKEPRNPTASATITQDTATNPRTSHRYQSSIEDPKIVDAVIQRALQGTVQMNMKELLAIAPDVRKGIREQLQPKRVPQEATVTIHTCEHCKAPETQDEDDDAGIASLYQVDDNVKVPVVQSFHNAIASARSIEPLRVIYPVIEEKLRVEAIVDSGSEIVAMRRGVWELLNMGVSLDEGCTMESANSSRDKTLGLFKNVRFDVAGIRIYVHFQIVENAPYDILLGRPFHCVLSAITQDYPDGRSDITLRDSTTGHRQMIPTGLRLRRPPEPVEQCEAFHKSMSL
ncbi:hypothetical protein PC9H_006959 [Pleurotus ostreatus]|uniref:Peptidase A2 domain-containing protein n=1 Tax=Pleurotus ostreatus TaxID=5322 RepID=A0A8H7DTH5_PLEOS|nr:uncharacterized protein PC9H_006959 [Pleurotus ostreatus]KAF7431238.1 hypothetical protein PC9H_006959 [Pleurotus ostreatus]